MGSSMTMKKGLVAAALSLLALGAGCTHRIPAALNGGDEPFRIGREDVLDINVWKEAELSKTIPVRPDGFISLPMAGELQAEGKTPSELEDAIKQKLAHYIQDPKVTVIVHEVNSARVFVTGEVQHPGAYPLRGRVSVLQALALAGGLSEFANSGAIVVIRPGADGGRIPVSYSDLISAEGARKDVSLQPGDTVVVP